MFASRAVQKPTPDRTPSRAKQTSQGQTPGLRPLENVPEAIPPLQRYLGNSYVQAMTATGGETPQAPAVSPIVHSVPRRPIKSGLLQRKCACGGAAGMSGECEECSKQKRLGLQTKLTVNQPGDIYEREADRVADQVLATSAHTGVSGAPPHIQRFSGQSPGQTDAAPASVDQAMASPGRPLEAGLRQDMEQRFGHDFGRVRVHADAAAEQSVQEVNANAYTVGHHIMFGAGQFAPGKLEGRRLIAHELTHVLQQTGTIQPRVQRQAKPSKVVFQQTIPDPDPEPIRLVPSTVSMPLLQVVATPSEGWISYKGRSVTEILFAYQFSPPNPERNYPIIHIIAGPGVSIQLEGFPGFYVLEPKNTIPHVEIIRAQSPNQVPPIGTQFNPSDYTGIKAVDPPRAVFRSV
jgi:Domain of unknown function (DUF4157)